MGFLCLGRILIERRENDPEEQDVGDGVYQCCKLATYLRLEHSQPFQEMGTFSGREEEEMGETGVEREAKGSPLDPTGAASLPFSPGLPAHLFLEQSHAFAASIKVSGLSLM